MINWWFICLLTYTDELFDNVHIIAEAGWWNSLMLCPLSVSIHVYSWFHIKMFSYAAGNIAKTWYPHIFQSLKAEKISIYQIAVTMH